MLNHKIRIKAFIGLFLFGLAATIEGFAMSFFDRPPEEVVLASPMSGQITLHGKPAAGAKVVRKVRQNDGEEFIDEVTADSDGRFELPVLKKKITLKKLEQYVVEQNIHVLYAGEDYGIWEMSSFSKQKYGELNGKPANLLCELTSERRVFTRLTEMEGVEVNGILGTKCSWDYIEKFL